MDRILLELSEHEQVEDYAALGEALVEFAHSCDVRVIAEGVETAGEHAVLRDLGVDRGQGWLFGRPGPADLLVDEGTVLAHPSADRVLQ